MSFLWCSSVGKGKCHEHCAFGPTFPQTSVAWSEGIVQCRSGEPRLRAKPCRQVWGAAAPGQILPLHVQPQHQGCAAEAPRPRPCCVHGALPEAAWRRFFPCIGPPSPARSAQRTAGEDNTPKT